MQRGHLSRVEGFRLHRYLDSGSLVARENESDLLLDVSIGNRDFDLSLQVFQLQPPRALVHINSTKLT